MLKASPIKNSAGVVDKIVIQLEEGLSEAFSIKAEPKIDGTYMAVVRLKGGYIIASGNPCVTPVGALNNGIQKLKAYFRLKVFELENLEEEPKTFSKHKYTN